MGHGVLADDILFRGSNCSGGSGGSGIVAYLGTYSIYLGIHGWYLHSIGGPSGLTTV